MITGLTEFKDFSLIRKPEVESYTFRGKDFVYWFNITFAEGRIFLTGDCGDNVFTVRETDIAGLKNWLLNLDEGYALGKGIHKHDYFEEDYATNAIKEHLEDQEYPEDKINEIISQLDFSSCDTLLNSMCSTKELLDIFPEYWEMGVMTLQWSPMLKMQYKQLKFAGDWLRNIERK
ncbi:MAG: hypothetical protein Q8O46_02435 [bacterium]|nr:hypothetical protein [bacterium]